MSDEPLFMVGVGRSGSSFIARLISHHPRLGFLTDLANRFPSEPWRNRWILRCMSLPVAGSVVRRRYEISEAYRFWEASAKGFSEPMRDLRATDVTPFVRRRLIRSLEHAVPPSRHRLFAKITGWSRIGFLNELFPDARFVHLVRDGRDVANSLLRVSFWKGWRGPHNWRFGPLSDENRSIWEEHDRSFVVLAGLAWKILVNSVEEARPILSGERFLEVRYEDFLEAPTKEIRRITDFADLEWCQKLGQTIDDADVRDQAGRYREDLTPDQADRLTSELRPALERYGYA